MNPRVKRDPKDPELVELGDRLRAFRTEAGLTQEGLADVSDLHWTYVGQVERGERNVTFRSLVRLARALDLPPGKLMPEK